MGQDTGVRSRRRSIVVAAVVLAVLIVAGGVALAVRRPASPGPPPAALPTGTAVPRSASAAPAAVPLPTGTAVPRASSPLERFAAIAGSDSWLLYAQTTRDDRVPVTGDALPDARNPRFLLSSTGRRIAVPEEATVSLLGDEPLVLRLETKPRFPALPIANPSNGPVDLRWSLPGSGRSGTAVLPARTRVDAFGPGGTWVTATQVGTGKEDTQFAPIDRLTRVFPSGRRVDLGVPFPEGAPYTTASSESGLLAWSDAGDGGDQPPNGQIRFHPWDSGAWRTLDPGYPPQGEIACSTPSPESVVCGLVGADRRTRSLLLRLPEGTATEMRQPAAFPERCAAAQISLGTAVLGIVSDDRIDGRTCPAGRLTRLEPDGSVRLSSRVYDRFHAPVVAFGRIVVDEAREHRLLAVQDVDAAPQVVVGR